jgi:hypothetical protein
VRSVSSDGESSARSDGKQATPTAVKRQRGSGLRI